MQGICVKDNVSQLNNTRALEPIFTYLPLLRIRIPVAIR